MNTHVFFTVVWIIFFSTNLLSDEVIGFWKILDDDNERPLTIVAIYEYQEKIYGRIIASYNGEGVLDDTIYNPKDRATNLDENPFFSGLDIIWNLKYNGKIFCGGEILDPEKGRVYNAEIWSKEGILYVRGKILFFGQNVKWYPLLDEDLPKGFEKPDLTKFIPTIPRVKS